MLKQETQLFSHPKTIVTILLKIKHIEQVKFIMKRQGHQVKKVKVKIVKEARREMI